MEQKRIYNLIEILMGTYIDKVIEERKMNNRLLLPTIDKEELIYQKAQADKKIACIINNKLIDKIYNQNKKTYNDICELANYIIYTLNNKEETKLKKLKR